MDLHARAMDLSRRYKRLENELILVLQQIDRVKLYKNHGHSSLFLYATKELGLSEAFAYAIISVARKAAILPALQESLQNQKISVHKASRIVSTLNERNAGVLIEFAVNHSSREIDREVARLNPAAPEKDRTKFINEDSMKMEVTISQETFEKWKRVQDLVASKTRKSSESFGALFDLMIENYLDRHDPIRKAGRSFGRQLRRQSLARKKVVMRSKANQNLNQEPNQKPNQNQQKFCARRKPLLAWQRHAVVQRDGGRCTHVDSQGRRCSNERWTHFHHVQTVASGGGNEPENLKTLCWFHHDLVHQLSFPIHERVAGGC